MNPSISVDVSKKQVRWNTYAPQYVNFATHKFSIIDAIEMASQLLGTDYTREIETLIAGQNARVIIMTLPQFMEAARTPQGFMQAVDDKALLGVLGHRTVLFDRNGKLADSLILQKADEKVEILLTHSPGN